MHPLHAVQESVLPPAWHRKVMLNVARLVAHVEQAGFTLEVGDSLEHTAPIFRASGQPLAVLADPDVWNPERSRPRTLTLILHGPHGALGCTAQRHVWVRDLAADMEQLSFWYGRQDLAPPGTRCYVPNSWLGEVRDSWVVYSCSFAVLPDAQKPGIAYALIRIAHALALIKWPWDWLLGRGKPGIAFNYGFDRYGINAMAAGVFLLGPGVEPSREHSHILMGSRRAAFVEQAAHPEYGNPEARLSIPPSLRPNPLESSG